MSLPSRLSHKIPLSTQIAAMSILDLPIEVRLQIWLNCLEALCPLGSRPVQICASFDRLCGYQYEPFQNPMLPILLSTKSIHTDVSKNFSRTELGVHTFRFCSPECVVRILSRTTCFPIDLVKDVEVNTCGSWGVPVERVVRVCQRIIGLLQDASTKHNTGRDKQAAEGSNALWAAKFKEQAKAGSPPWRLVFHRLE